MGAAPVDIEGNDAYIIQSIRKKDVELNFTVTLPSVNDSSIEDRIYDFLSKGTYSSKQIIDGLNLSNYSIQKMSSILSKMKNINKIKEGKSTKYSLLSTKRPTQLSLML